VFSGEVTNTNFVAH